MLGRENLNFGIPLALTNANVGSCAAETFVSRDNVSISRNLGEGGAVGPAPVYACWTGYERFKERLGEMLTGGTGGCVSPAIAINCKIDSMEESCRAHGGSKVRRSGKILGIVLAECRAAIAFRQGVMRLIRRGRCGGGAIGR